jgi:hypothetical protein
MTTSELIAHAYLLAKRKTTVLTAGTAKYDQLLAIANIKIDDWQNEQDWNSQYAVVSLPTVVSATDTIPLTASVRKISKNDGDYIRILHTDGVAESVYTFVEADELYKYRTSNAVTRVGSNLVFSRAFEATDPQIGGTVKVPCYTTASSLVDAGDLVPVDDAYWLAYATAAEYIRFDFTLRDQADILLNTANQRMEKMMEADQGQFNVVHRVPLGIRFGRSW